MNSLIQPSDKIPILRHARSATMDSMLHPTPAAIESVFPSCQDTILGRINQDLISIIQSYSIQSQNQNIENILPLCRNSSLNPIGRYSEQIIQSRIVAKSGRQILPCPCGLHVPLCFCERKRTCESSGGIEWVLFSELSDESKYNIETDARCKCGVMFAGTFRFPSNENVKRIPIQYLCVCGTISPSYPCELCDGTRLTECACYSSYMSSYGDNSCSDLIDLHEVPHVPLCPSCYECPRCSRPFTYSFSGGCAYRDCGSHLCCEYGIEEIDFNRDMIDKICEKK